jgi:[ribosomal protein S5]-alanine N-acetyltransferase
VRIEVPDPLTDGVVALRPLRAADAPAFAQAFSDDPELGVAIGVEEDPGEDAFLERLPRGATAAAQGEYVEFAIADHETDEFCGIVVLLSFDWRHLRCEVGLWLAPRARGRGLARRAVGLSLDWVFDSLEFRRVELTTLPENEATVRLAEDLGFRQEGLLRQRNFERGRTLDVLWFGLLREEWKARR